MLEIRATCRLFLQFLLKLVNVSLFHRKVRRIGFSKSEILIIRDFAVVVCSFGLQRPRFRILLRSTIT